MSIDDPDGAPEPRSAVLSSPGVRSAWLLALLLPAIGLVWALVNPQGAAPDEPSHVLYAAAVVRGDLGHGADGQVLVLPRQIARYPFRVCMAFKPTAPLWKCGTSQIPTNETREVSVTSKAAGYPPLYYALVGWPTLFGFNGAIWLTMRLISVGLAAFLVGLPLILTRRVLPRWGQLATVLSLTPLVVFLTAVVNPDGSEIAAAIGLGISVVGLHASFRVGSIRDARLAAICLSVTTGYLLLARPFSFVEALALLAIYALATPRRYWRNSSSAFIGFTLVLIPLACLGIAVAFSVGNHHLAADALIGSPSRPVNLTTGLHKLPRWLSETVGLFGWNDYRLPPLISWTWLGVVGLLGVVAIRLGNAWHRFLLLITAVGAVGAMPILTSVIVYKGDYSQFQGRYEWPLLAGVVFICALVLAERSTMDPRGTPRLPRPAMLLTALIFMCALQLVSWAATVVRYGAGMADRGGLLAGPEFRWYVGASGTIALAISGVAFLALAVALGRQLARPAAALDPDPTR